ncbi:hypothetical protein J3R83DRAFT_1606 [Lanmaoa asiatica]|nr:hypothetical protein J3R83DRAFT_1606 [Lanmaoa asiatica]
MSRPQDDRNQEATVYLVRIMQMHLYGVSNRPGNQGNLDERVTDPIVWELMLQAGPVGTPPNCRTVHQKILKYCLLVNVHLPKDRVSMAHQGYGFCEFLTEEDAEYACKIMNQIKLWGKPIRVNKASSDKKQLDVGANLFIGNLDDNVDERLLYDTFSAFGVMATTAKIARDPSSGISKGYGFVSYTDFESSDAAIESMNGQFLMNKAITVQYAFKKDGKGERHGTSAERLLAAQARKNNALPVNARPPPAPMAFGARPPMPGFQGPYQDGGVSDDAYDECAGWDADGDAAAADSEYVHVRAWYVPPATTTWIYAWDDAAAGRDASSSPSCTAVLVCMSTHSTTIMSLQPIVSLYQYALTPLAPFSWFGLKISSLDLVAAFRLCYVLRHMRENLRDEHTKRRATDSKLPPPEDRSFTRDALTVLTVVYGGEAIAAPLLGVPSSFMISGVGPLLYIIAQALVDALPFLPPMGLNSELPLSILDGHTRAMLVCTLVPPVVLQSPLPAVSDSPWALLLSSFLITNGGFFITNLVSFLHPTPLMLTTPGELQPRTWGTGGVGGAGVGVGKIAPLDPETARSACALVLAVLFASRTARQFGFVGKRGVAEKIKTN